LANGAKLFQPTQRLPERVTLESPALDVMTDLQQFPARTIEPEASIEAANAKMIRYSVRLLFVVDPLDRLLGLITATDILGEKVLQAMQAREVSRQEVLVQEIMTPREGLEAIDIEDLRGPKVGHVLATLKQAGRHHAIVVEIREPTFQDRLAMLSEGTPLQTVRGLFSTTQIARQLGLQPQGPDLATTFAEVEALFAH
jgi:CBS domain-containing protein